MIVNLIAVLIFPYPGIGATACEVPNESRTRVFDSFLHYKKNRIPFGPSKRNWGGSNVEFSAFNLRNLTIGTFTTFTSESIIGLKLSGKNITDVENGAFVSLLCLRELLLDHNNITKITKDGFQDLNTLRALDLSYNNLENVENFVFSDLLQLKNLNLSNNHIRNLEVSAFTNLTSLLHLNLAKNLIVQILPNLFHPLTSLVTLVLSWNRLREVEMGRWHLLNLQSLELAGNRLTNFNPKTFSPLRNLNLSFNSLIELNTVELKRHLPRLELLDLNNNPWTCDVLESILYEMNDSKVKFVSSKNSTAIGLDDMACGEEVPKFTDAIVSTTTRSAVVNQEQMKTYIDRKLRESREELTNSIKTLQISIIVMFAFVCVFILIEVSLRTNICKFLADKFRLETTENESDAENFRLMSSSHSRHSHSHSHVL